MSRDLNPVLARAKNKKNGNKYDIMRRGVINATNGHENDGTMYLYEYNGEYFVRDEAEFEEKFEHVEMKQPSSKPIAGKLYTSKSSPGKMVLMCTGEGKTPNTMAAVVVRQEDEFSDFKLGDFSNTWTWIPDSDNPNFPVFVEYEGRVQLDNEDWSEPVEIGHAPG